jgi:hypothetical protein
MDDILKVHALQKEASSLPLSLGKNLGSDQIGVALRQHLSLHAAQPRQSLFGPWTPIGQSTRRPLHEFHLESQGDGAIKRLGYKPDHL